MKTITYGVKVKGKPATISMVDLKLIHYSFQTIFKSHLWQKNAKVTFFKNTKNKSSWKI